MNKERSLHPIQGMTYFLLAVVLLVYILYTASFIIVPLVWGMFFAFSLHPLCEWLERKGIPRVMAILSSIILIGTVFLGLIFLLTNQMIALITDIPSIGQSFWAKLDQYLDEIQSFLEIDFDFDELNWSVYNFLSPDKLNATLFSTGRSLTLVGIVPLYIFLLLYYQDFFAEFIRRVSIRSNARILEWANDVGKVIQGYIVGTVKVTLIVSLFSGVFFYAIGIEYFVLFAVWIAVMNLIPYIGVFISSTLVILYVFLTTDTLFYPLLTLVVLWSIQLLENNIITPWLVGSKVNVNALAVILAILIGGGIWGVSGMVLFIPLTAILKITFDRIPALSPYGYLLGDDFPERKRKADFWGTLFGKFKNRE